MEGGRPTLVRIQFSTPSCGWNIMVQTSATATGVAIMGRMKTARARPRSGKRRWKASAAARPNTSGNTTASTV